MDDKPSVFTSISQYFSTAKLNEKNRTYQSRPILIDGKPIFEPKDLAGIINPAAILLRLIMIHYKITEQEFNERHYQFKRNMGKTGGQINQDIGNLRKSFKSPRLTIDKLEEIIHSCGFEITDYSITLRDKHTGVCDTFHSSLADDIHAPLDYDQLVSEEDDDEDTYTPESDDD